LLDQNLDDLRTDAYGFIFKILNLTHFF
jgi:hypothetical protein